MQINLKKLELELSDKNRAGLLNRENAIRFIEALQKNNVCVFGFDGFNINGNIKTSRFFMTDDKSIQPNQDLSRDYSAYTKEQAYKLCMEYFYKDKSVGTLYEISYPRDEA
jgi:hypothetical protein